MPHFWPVLPEVGILMGPTPPPWVVLWNHQVTWKLHFSPRAAMGWRQNLEKKAVFKVSNASKTSPPRTLSAIRIPTLSVAHNATLRMGHPNLQTTLRPPRDSPRGKGQGRFPTARFSKIVGLSYGQIQSPQRILSPWRRGTFAATLNSQKMIKDVGVGGHGTA